MSVFRRVVLVCAALATIVAAAVLPIGSSTISGRTAPATSRPGGALNDQQIARFLAEHNVQNPSLMFIALPTTCRFANTGIKGGAFGSHATRTYQVTGSSGFTAQGGTSTGCGIPSSAVSVAVSVTTTNSTATGGLLVYPAGKPRVPGRTESMIRGSDSTASANVALGTGGKVSVYNGSPGSTQLLLETAGYYVQQISALLYTGPSTYIYSGTTRILSTTYASTGQVDVTVDTDVGSSCTLIAAPYYSGGYFANAQPLGGSKFRLQTQLLNSTTHVAAASDTFAWVYISC